LKKKTIYLNFTQNADTIGLILFKGEIEPKKVKFVSQSGQKNKNT